MLQNQNAKTIMCNKLSQLLSRPLTKEDIGYETKKTSEVPGEEEYQSTITVKCLPEAIEVEGPVTKAPPPAEAKEIEGAAEMSAEELADKKEKEAKDADCKRNEKAKKAAEIAACEALLEKHQEVFSKIPEASGKSKGTKRKASDSTAGGEPPAAAAPAGKRVKVNGGLVPVDVAGTTAGAGGGIATLLASGNGKNDLNKAVARILKRCVTKGEMVFTTKAVEDGHQCTFRIPELPLQYSSIPTTGAILPDEHSAEQDACVKAIKAIAVIQRILSMKGAKKYKMS